MGSTSKVAVRGSRAGLLFVLAGAAPALAQTAPLRSHEVPWKSDSGSIASPVSGDARAVYSTAVFVPRASWLRLRFGAIELPGRVEEGRGSYLKITSLRDGKSQVLNAVSAAQWVGTSAYFNGDAVSVELMAYPGTGANRVVIRSVIAGDDVGGAGDTICGPTDDRTLSSDPRSARHYPEGCSSWLFNDTNRTFITAGHCGVTAGDVQEFNVPLSNANGSVVHPGPEDQYVVDPTSVQFANITLGADYTYFACFPNSNTGMTAFQKQGQYYTLATSVPAVSGQVLRITGFGVTSSGVAPLPWSQVQKTHTGPYTQFTGSVVYHQVDTTGGNSGSAVENLTNNTVIAIHTNAGCTAGSGSNSACGLNYAGLQSALAAPRTLCLTGKGVVTGSLFALGDGANNFGTLNTASGNFAKVKDGPVRAEGLAYNWNIGKFYAINNDTNPAAPGMRLYTIDPGTGNAAFVALVTGATGPINGLGYDPVARVLYGVAQANGQLYTINTTTGAATTIGPVTGGSVGGLEFSPAANALFGIDDSGGVSKLLKWNNPAGAPALVGALGAGIADCNGLAVTDSGDLWTINAATEQLLKINPATGAATVIGPTGGIFGASYGMSAVLTAPPTGCYANCDGSSTNPMLTANDFQCFLNEFAAGNSYANCDGSTAQPTLTANDFQCFLNAFAAGCS